MDTSLTNPSSLDWRDEPLEMSVVNQQLLTGLGVVVAAVRNAAAAVLAPRNNTSLTLYYGGQKLHFPTPHEFEFALTTRTEVPAQRLPEFERLSSAQLRDTVHDIRQLEVDFGTLLSQARDAGGSMRSLLSDFDTNRFSKDHEWRALFRALADSESELHDPYRFVALGKYTHYLVSRRNVLQAIRITREAEGRRKPARAHGAKWQRRARAPGSMLVGAGVRDSSEKNGYWTLPSGTPIGIDLSDPTPFRILLSAYPFRIEQDAGQLRLVDVNAGVEYPLQNGRNTIGRAKDADVVVDGTYREVSRMHAVVNVIDSRMLLITDQSAHGTSVPNARIVGA